MITTQGDILTAKSRGDHVTAEDPKQFFQMFDIYSGNVMCEGYREIFSSCEDIDA